MKREVFERFVRESFELGSTASELIGMIEKLVEQEGYLTLYTDGKEEKVFSKAWLNNFKYKEYIKQYERADC